MRERHKNRQNTREVGGAVGTLRRADADKKAISDTAMITLEAYAVCGIPLAGAFITAIRGRRADGKSWLVPEGSKKISPEQTVLLRARYLGADIVVRRL